MVKRRIACASAVLFLLVVTSSGVIGQVGWRSDWTGLYPDATPPFTWSTDQNVIWKTPLATWSNASAVLYRRLLFFCEEPSTLVCADSLAGKILWKAKNEYQDILPPDEAAKLGKKPRTHGTNGYASSTPVAGTRKVFALFGNGVAACYNLKGKKVWARFVAKSTNAWGHSASPVLVGGKLIVHIANTVYGLDPATGETAWTAASAQFWGTPLPIRFGEKDYAILTTGGIIIRVSDGKIVAKGIGQMPWTSPIAHNGVLYIVDTNGAFAYRLPDKLSDPLELEKLWQTKVPKDRYYASSIVKDGLLYAATQRGIMSVLDITDGSTVYSHTFRLGGTFYSSFHLAGDKIFISGEKGKTAVFEPGRQYKEVVVNTLDSFRTNFVLDGSRMYIRTLKNLYCLGNTSQ